MCTVGADKPATRATADSKAEKGSASDALLAATSIAASDGKPAEGQPTVNVTSVTGGWLPPS